MTAPNALQPQALDGWLNNNLYSAVKRLAVFSQVCCDRIFLAKALWDHARRVDAVFVQYAGHGRGAPRAEGKVVLRCARAVGVTLHLNHAVGVLLQVICKGLQIADKAGCNNRAVGGKQNVLGQGYDQL